jgi:hypothetical protein
MKTEKKFDLTTSLIEYEAGNATKEEIIELFQHLLDTGLAWKLQGSYGRATEILLGQNLITKKGDK